MTPCRAALTIRSAMENNTAVSPSSTLPSSEAKPKPVTTTKQAKKKPAKKTKKAKAKAANMAKPKKASTSALTKTLTLSDAMQERLDRFRRHFKRGVATRSELKEANKKLFRKEWSPAYITKNRAFKIPSVPGLYSLVAQKGAAATAAAVKSYLAAQEAAKAKLSAKSKPSAKASAALKKAS